MKKRNINQPQNSRQKQTALDRMSYLRKIGRETIESKRFICNLGTFMAAQRGLYRKRYKENGLVADENYITPAEMRIDRLDKAILEEKLSVYNLPKAQVEKIINYIFKNSHCSIRSFDLNDYNIQDELSLEQAQF